jgi:hypothetical protein
MAGAVQVPYEHKANKRLWYLSSCLLASGKALRTAQASLPQELFIGIADERFSDRMSAREKGADMSSPPKRRKRRPWQQPQHLVRLRDAEREHVSAPILEKADGQMPA